jgi:hypothetical protein
VKELSEEPNWSRTWGREGLSDLSRTTNRPEMGGAAIGDGGEFDQPFRSCFCGHLATIWERTSPYLLNMEAFLSGHQPTLAPFGVCWLLVTSVGLNGPVRTPPAVSCSLLIPQRKSTIESMHLLIFIKGEWTLCRGFSPSSRP